MADGGRSYIREIVVAVAIALLAGGSAPWWISALFDNDDDSESQTAEPPEATRANTGGLPDLPDLGECSKPSISLSRGAGPSGTRVTVSGRGFAADTEVELNFHTEALPPSRTGSEGTFSQEVVIPGSFDAFAPQQFQIRALSKGPICSDDAPFQLTRS